MAVTKPEVINANYIFHKDASSIIKKKGPAGSSFLNYLLAFYLFMFPFSAVFGAFGTLSPVLIFLLFLSTCGSMYFAKRSIQFGLEAIDGPYGFFKKYIAFSSLIGSASLIALVVVFVLITALALFI